MNQTSEFSKWLEDRMHELRLSNAELGRRIGVSGQMVSLYQKGSVPSSDKIPALAEALETDQEYLLKRIEGQAIIEVKENDLLGGTSVLIVHEAKISAGTGLSEYENQVRAQFDVHRYILRNYLGIPDPPARIGVAEVSGDCMMPDLKEGDAVFFAYDRRFSGNGRYVIWAEYGPEVKRLQQLRDGSILISCDNRSVGYQDEILIPGEDGSFVLKNTGRPVDLLIVGPVIWPRKSVSSMLMEEVKQLIIQGYRNARQD